MIHIALGYMVGAGIGMLIVGGHVVTGIFLIGLGTAALIQHLEEC